MCQNVSREKKKTKEKPTKKTHIEIVANLSFRIRIHDFTN